MAVADLQSTCFPLPSLRLKAHAPQASSSLASIPASHVREHVACATDRCACRNGSMAVVRPWE